MTDVEIIALLVTFIGVLCIASIITILYHSYITSVIKEIRIGRQDADLLVDLIKEGNEKLQKRKKMIAFSKNAIFCVFLAIIVPIFVMAFVSKMNNDVLMLGDNSIIVVASGSMSEAHENNTFIKENPQFKNRLQTYDIIGLKKVHKQSDVRVGDIIAYTNDKKITIIHRVIQIIIEDEVVKFKTQGDANDKIDEYRPVFEDIVGEYNGKRVPMLGMFVLFFQSPSGLVTAIAAIYCLIMMDALSNKMNKQADRRCDLLNSIYEIDKMKEEDIINSKVANVQYVIMKSYMYRISELGLIDKTPINSDYPDKKLLDVVTHLEENLEKENQVNTKKNNDTKQINPQVKKVPTQNQSGKVNKVTTNGNKVVNKVPINQNKTATTGNNKPSSAPTTYTTDIGSNKSTK